MLRHRILLGCADKAMCISATAAETFMHLHLHAQVQPPRISMRDFEKVLLRARPTVSGKDLKEFEQFTAEFGEEG